MLLTYFYFLLILPLDDYFLPFLLLIFSFAMLGIIIHSIWKHDWKVRWPGTKGISIIRSSFVDLVPLSSSPWKEEEGSPSPAAERAPWHCVSPEPLCKGWAALRRGIFHHGCVEPLQHLPWSCSSQQGAAARGHQRGKHEQPPETDGDALCPELPLMLCTI